MTDYSKSPLMDPKFLAEASAGNLAGALDNDEGFVQSVVTSNREGNDLTADETFGNDILSMGYAALERKYGREVADNQGKYQREIETQRAALDDKRTIPQVAGDTALAVGAGAVGIAGSLASGSLAAAGAVDQYFNPSKDGFSKAAVILSGLTDNATNFIRSGQSEELQDRKELSAIEGVLDTADSQAQYDRDIADGDNAFIASLAQTGRDVINTGERVLRDGAVASDIIAEGVGSLGPSAKVASAASRKAQNLFIPGGNVALTKAAGTAGAALGVGVSEGSGVYTQTVNEIMGMSTDSLMETSDHFRSMVNEGMDPEEARIHVAGVAGELAFARQIPTATVLGLLSAKFEAAPISSFRGSGLLGGFKQIGAQTLEEGLQGGSGTFNTNLAIKQIVDDGRSLIDGLGENIAVGAIAGAGMAGALATPTTAAGAVSTAIDVATSETTSDILKAAVRTGGTGAANTLDTVASGAKAAAPYVAPVVDKARPVVQAAAVKVKTASQPAVDAVSDIANRPNVNIQSAKIAAARTVVDVVEGYPVADSAVQKLATAQTDTTPSTFAETIPEGSSLVQSVAGILETMSTKKVNVARMTDQELLYVADKVQQLKSVSKNLPADVKSAVKDVLSSPDFLRVQKRMTKIDLNQTQTETTEVTPDIVADTLRVARLNPTNVNPTVTNKILKHSARKDLTEEDVRLLTAAGRIAEAVNNHGEGKVQISKDTRVALSQKPAYKAKPERLPNPLTSEDVSRSIQVDGYTDKRGKKLRSVNDFAADIYKAAQSEDQSFTDEEGFVVSGSSVATQFQKFVTHMNNKVAALNESRANFVPGQNAAISFEGLVNGDTFVPAGTKGASGKDIHSVYVNPDSPKSVQNAKNVSNDALVAQNVYNILVETFPDLFPAGELSVAQFEDNVTQDDLSITEDTQEDTTAVEEEVSPEAETSDEQQTEEAEVQTVDEATDEVLSEKVLFENLPNHFSDAYNVTGNERGFSNGDELLDLIEDQTYTKFVGMMMKPTMKAVNKRLDTIKMSKKDQRSLKEALQAGENISEINRLKALSIVDPETGVYDEQLLSLATVAVLDWLTSARAADPSRLDETMEDLGITDTDISSKSVIEMLKRNNPNKEINGRTIKEDIMFGISPRQATEDISKQVLRLWGLEVNQDVGMNDSRGIVESVVKEVISVLGASGKLLQINDIPTRNKEGKIVSTQTLNVKAMKNIQTNMGVQAQGSVQKFTAPENNTAPSFGVKIATTDQTQSRGKVVLSKLEKSALKRMQDTPHFVSQGISSLVETIGFEPLSRMLGHVDMETFRGNDVLARSVEGKNMSIERDFDEAMQILNGARQASDDETQVPVYYPVSISKVGRHQFKGINPQNNKILRAMVTPTHATLDMTSKDDQDAFWLTVAQASDLFKVENQDHKMILNKVQNDFNATYNDALDLVVEWLRTGELNSKAFQEAMGPASMQQLSAVFAVAQLEFAKANGTESSFDTTLSFELDGKTDGPANMMSNFGQGLLTKQDVSNFNRVGYFLGRTGMTLNKYFSVGNVDLYEVTSKKAEAEMMRKIHKAKSPADRAILEASARFAARFGDFALDVESGDITMTRNTSKNPMTKTVYGSGVQGVGSGIAQDMILEFYRTFTEEGSFDAYQGYDDLAADVKLLFGDDLPANFNTADMQFGEDSVKRFEEVITKGIGEIISASAKSVIGPKITKVNDALVFLTNVQTEYLQTVFDQKLTALIDQQIASGKISNRTQLSQRDYNRLVQELSVYAPLYSNGSQSLAVGAFSRQTSDIVLSKALDGKLSQKASMVRPDTAGVKVIPYISIGRGDAMMMNTIYGSDNAPTDTLPVFDGIDMPVNKVKAYAGQINQAVMANWDRDVLTDIVQDYQSFLAHVGKDPLLAQAFEAVVERTKNTTVTDTTAEELMRTLKGMHRQNQARKKVFKNISVSVDHMGGSATSFSRGEGDVMDETEINALISAELETKEQALPETEQYDELNTVAADTLVEALFRTSTDKIIKQTLAYTVRGKLPAGLTIVTGSLEQLNKYRQETFGNDGQVLTGAGNYDEANNTIFLSKKGDETLAHELVHAATYKQVKGHYEGENNPAVERLEALMNEFMGLDFSSADANVRESVNATRQAILESSVNSKADAVNEFMAWTLTNKPLGQTLKTTRTITKLVGQALSMIKRLMGGIPNDMFSHILFNTAMLDRSVSTPEEGGNNGNNNDDGELTPSAHKQTNFWIDLIKQRIDESREPGERNGKSSRDRAAQLQRYQNAARDAVNKLDFGGFSLSEYQKETFRAIHGVLALEMRLDTKSVLAMRKTFDFVTDNLTPDMFGPNNAQERYSTVMDLFGATQNDEGISDAIAVLLALSQTSRGFRNALDQLPTPENQDPKAVDLNSFLSIVANVMMRKVVGTIDTADSSVKDMLDALAENLIIEDSEKEYALVRGLMSSFTKADEYTNGAMSKLANLTADVDEVARESNRSRLTKFVTGSVAFATSFLDETRSNKSLDAIKNVTHMGRTLDWAVPIQEFVSEVIGTDATNSPTVALLDRTNKAIQQVRQAFREDLPVLLQQAFDTAPDAEQWKSLHSVLGKGDFSVLFDINNPNVSMDLITKSGLLDRKIVALEKAIEANFSTPVADIILEKSQQLSGFMNGNGAGHQLWRNAYAINKLAGEFDVAMTEDIDRLISMYALQGMPEADRQAVADMYKNDADGVKNLIVYMQGLNLEEDLKDVSEAAKFNGYKGFVPNHPAAGTRMVIEDDSRGDDLIKMGFTRIGDYNGDSKFSTNKRGYYFTSVKQGGGYSQGVLQAVHDSYRGVDSTTGLTVNGTVSGIISGSAADSVTEALNDGQGVPDIKEVVMPVYDNDGGVIYYERAINPDIFKQYMKPVGNLALMLGSWAGRQVEEKFAQQYNNELIDQLKVVYDNREQGGESIFVDLSSIDLKDPIYRDSWNMIPNQTKTYIREVFGDDGFPVKKDMINLALGYREASILDVWTGKTRLPKNVQTAIRAISNITLGKLGDGTHAVSLLSQGEEGLQSVVSKAKDLIVVRSMVVLYMNMQANVMQLTTRGVSVKDMVKGYRDKFQEIEAYNENEKKLILLDTQIRLAGADKNQVSIYEAQRQTIYDENSRMSIAPLITAGAYKNISEGITEIDVELTSGRVGEWIESQTNKLPAGAQTIAKYGIIARDTALYRGANKAVQYGDFLAKAVMYDHLTKNKGNTYDEAIAKINEEFVNFSVLPGRFRSTMESYGLSWFMTFKIRIMKIAMNLMRENPARALLVASTVGDMGSPVADNLATVIAQDRLDYSLGWDMLFGAPELNPWYNLIND